MLDRPDILRPNVWWAVMVRPSSGHFGKWGCAEGAPDEVQRVYYLWALQQDTSGFVSTDGKAYPPRWQVRPPRTDPPDDCCLQHCVPQCHFDANIILSLHDLSRGFNDNGMTCRMDGLLWTAMHGMRRSDRHATSARSRLNRSSYFLWRGASGRHTNPCAAGCCTASRAADDPWCFRVQLKEMLIHGMVALVG